MLDCEFSRFLRGRLTRKEWAIYEQYVQPGPTGHFMLVKVRDIQKDCGVGLHYLYDVFLPKIEDEAETWEANQEFSGTE